MASSKTKGKSKKRTKDKLSTGKKKEEMRPEELKFLSPDEKMQYLLENGHLIKGRLFNQVPLKKGKLLPKEAFDPNNLISKSSELKKRNSHNLNYLDQILMSEFNISSQSNNDIQRDKPTNKENNNDTDISDQNNTVTSSKENSKDTKIIKDANKAFDNVIQNENADTTVSEDASSSKVSGHKKSKKIKLGKNNTATKVQKEMLEKYTNKLVGKLEKLGKVKLGNGIVLSVGTFQCDYCQKTLSTKSCLRRHIKVHLNIKPYSCAHCPMKFGQCCNWRSHMKKVHPAAAAREKYICLKCGKPFRTKEKFNMHLDDHYKKENPYKCVFCDKAFATHSLMAEHEKIHMNPGRYKCAICPMSFDSRTRYSLHIKSHLEVRDLFCPYCNKEFLRPSSIKRHVEIFHVGIRMECPICKKKLKGHLNEHMRTHENERPHECPECGQRFTQSTQLNVHRRCHTGDRPYTCRICKRPFTHSNALMLHIRRHTGEKPFTCAMCPVSFSQLPHMKSHMRRIHGKEKYYKCEKCNTFFKLKAELEVHEPNCEATVKEFTLGAQSSKKIIGQPAMTISKMRFLLALLFTMIASKDKLKYLGFNKRPIDDILVESVEAMGQDPCKDKSVEPLKRLKANIAMLLQGTVPKDQMMKFTKSNKTTEELLELLTEELLELLTGEKNKNKYVDLWDVKRIVR